MNHKHWCEIGKHEWECDGTQAVRVWAGETQTNALRGSARRRD